MSILIKGMDMPKYCYTCPAYDYIKSFCCVLRTKVINLNDNRYKDCPLIAVPTHGRLIDADKLLESFGEALDEDRHFVNYFALVDDEAPTVVEAEE